MKPSGLMPAIRRVVSKPSTSTSIAKLPLYTRLRPYTSPFSSEALCCRSATNGLWLCEEEPRLLTMDWMPWQSGRSATVRSFDHLPYRCTMS